MSVRAACAAVLLAALPASARPGWADKPDSADASGHRFVCEGQGKTEQDALAAAQGVCQDKICKVCGVEVESVVETRETLQGVDLQRKIVERCRRVRRTETKLSKRSVDCEDASCTAWIEVVYSKDDEQRDCSSYAREDFDDPDACEKDIEAFRRTQGRAAESFRVRTRLLDDALAHCARIDVRPTPALMALDEKLRAGQAQFEVVSDPRDGWSKPFLAYWLGPDPELKQRIAESKLLLDRIRLVRDLVAHKAKVFDVFEAAQAKDWDTAAGIERLRAALAKAPPGRRYGEPAVHFSVLFQLGRAETDTTSVGALVRTLYPAPEVDRGDLWTASTYFKGDDRTTEDEWRWTLAAHETKRCPECLRVLLAAEDHGAPEVRKQRALEALAAVRKNVPDAVRAFKLLVTYDQPAFFLELEESLPPEVKPAYDWDLFKEFLSRVDKLSLTDGKALAVRAGRALAAHSEKRGGEYAYCTQLAARLALVARAGVGEGVALADGRTCDCLTQTLAKERNLVNRSELLESARNRRLACAKGLKD